MSKPIYEDPRGHEAPKEYCRHCGRELITWDTYKPNKFDPYTGKPEVVHHGRCPEEPRTFWGQLLSYHANYSTDDVGSGLAD